MAIFRHALLERLSPLIPQVVRQWLANKRIQKFVHFSIFWLKYIAWKKRILNDCTVLDSNKLHERNFKVFCSFSKITLLPPPPSPPSKTHHRDGFGIYHVRQLEDKSQLWRYAHAHIWDLFQNQPIAACSIWRNQISWLELFFPTFLSSQGTGVMSWAKLSRLAAFCRFLEFTQTQTKCSVIATLYSGALSISRLSRAYGSAAVLQDAEIQVWRPLGAQELDWKAPCFDGKCKLILENFIEKKKRRPHPADMNERGRVGCASNVCHLWPHNTFRLESKAWKLSLIITGQLRCINMCLHNRLKQSCENDAIERKGNNF